MFVNLPLRPGEPVGGFDAGYRGRTGRQALPQGRKERPGELGLAPGGSQFEQTPEACGIGMTRRFRQ